MLMVAPSCSARWYARVKQAQLGPVVHAADSSSSARWRSAQLGPVALLAARRHRRCASAPVVL